MYLAALTISTLLLSKVHGHEKCPEGQNWQSLKHACWRETEKAMNFKAAINFCIGDDYQDGPGANLIPVGKLRHLVNPYHVNREGHHHVRFDKGSGPYHVNGVKSRDGLWREYPGGRIINFHHFPHFKAFEGHEGDTLNWDPEHNRIQISDKSDKFPVICYRPKRDPDCRLLCPGYSQDQECYNAGDCYNGECVCDRKFSGKMCQFMEREDAKLFIVGSSLNNATNVEIVDLESRESCLTSPLANIDGLYGALQGAYFDHKVHVCDGVTPNCYVYKSQDHHGRHESHGKNWTWNPIGQLHATRTQGASVLIPIYEHELKYPVVRGLNYGWQEHLAWWFSGGLPGSVSLKSSEILNREDEWRLSVALPFPDGLSYHCKVQINDCETAVIGGYSQSGATKTASNAVNVYNWKKEEWRLELELPLNNMSDPACGRIKDPYTDRMWILIAGGFDAALDVNTNRVWLWDPENNEVRAGPALPAANDGMHLIEYTETEVLVVGGYHGDQLILSFSFENGWQTWGHTRVINTLGAAMMVPKHFGSCR